jgi:hypothetical protein
MAPQDAPNSAVWNPYEGRYVAVEEILLDADVNGNPDSTKLKRWIMVNSKRPGLYIVITENPHMVVPTEANGGRDFFTRTESFFSSCTYTIVILDPRCAFLSKGDLS